MEEIQCEEDLKNICIINGENPFPLITLWKVNLYDNDICTINDTWQLGKQIGEASMFGTAHLANCKRIGQTEVDDKTYVFKIVKMNSREAFNKFNNEIQLQQKAASLHCASPIYQVL